jgi:hypothetical protein
VTAWKTITTLAKGALKFGFSFLLSIVGLASGIFAIVWLFGWLFYPQLQYSLEYSVDLDNVTVMPKPHSCDWDYAPMGKKGCHYEKFVTVSEGENHRRLIFVDWQRQEDP